MVLWEDCLILDRELIYRLKQVIKFKRIFLAWCHFYINYPFM